ncbi:MAG: carboxypeptidase regulatory-like domain-containing protein, partial [Acidobacteria bacterium]|nr:carboxypeptidase regulatory-like domain-containing protein [Acidobacteriota bacterium]
MRGVFGRLLVGVSIGTLACVEVWAQATGQISGRVTDPTSAVLPGVEVTVTQTGTGLARTAVTNETGAYTFPNLAVGPYRLEAMLSGFRTFVQTGITLQVGSNLTIDASLQVGELTQTVEVQANSVIQVETRGMSIGEVIENQRILELPLAARDTNSLILLSGAGAVDQGFGPVGTMVTGTRISVAGNQIFGVQHLLDGAIHMNRFNESNMPAPFPDALGEFRVNTSAQEASTGRASGASVNSVTKSGTNQFHGDVFWFVRNAVFNAQKADASRKDQLKRNQPGGTIGGPLVRNKLFFFTGYQGTIERSSPSDLFSIIPTRAMLSGDWSAFNSCYSPAWNAGAGLDFRDGVVDPARYSNAAKQLAARLPQTSDACGGIRTGSRGERHDKQSVSRIDYQRTPTHSIFGRYMATLQDAPVSFDSNNLLTATATSNSLDNVAHSAILGNTWVISPNTINASRFSYNRITTRLQGPQFFNPSDVGINQWTGVDKIFNFAVTGFFNFGAGTTARRQVFQNQYQIGNDTNLSRGAHQIAFGATWSRDDIDSVAHTRSVAQLTLDSAVTGNAMGDFLLGNVNNIRQSMPSILSPYQHYLGLYAQDT